MTSYVVIRNTQSSVSHTYSEVVAVGLPLDQAHDFIRRQDRITENDTIHHFDVLACNRNALSTFDKRVDSLIRYNSNQVVLRRVFKAQRDIAYEALERVLAVGDEYSQQIARDAMSKIDNFDYESMGKP